MVRVSPRRRPQSRANHVICYINVTGLVGVLLVLLVGFMVVPAPVHTNRMAVDLPRVAHPVKMCNVNDEDAILVSVNRDGQVFFGNDPIRIGDLHYKLPARISYNSELKVYINIDARAKYGGVKEVLDEVRDSGVEKIAFLVDQRKPVSASAAP